MRPQQRGAAVRLTVIDAMNVIGSRPETRWWRDRERAMRDLVRDLARWAEVEFEAGDDLLLVFDGYPTADLEQAPLPLIFAERAGPNGADDLIVEIVTDEPCRGTVRVVTSDAALRSRLRALGAEVVGVSTLLRELGAARKPATEGRTGADRPE